jgi:hypothetical protein
MASNFYHADTPADIKIAKVGSQSPVQITMARLMPGKIGASYDYPVNTEWQESSDYARRIEENLWN